MMILNQLVSNHQKYFNSQCTHNITWRISQLKKLRQVITNNENKITQALHDDLSKPNQESWMAEISYVTSEINHTIKHLRKWSKKRNVYSPLVTLPATSYIKPEPLGTVLIIGAWNYPFQLILAPLVAVIAAGNCAVLKPSELSPATSRLLKELITQALDNNAYSVVEGDVKETTQLLECKFDHIMYTGNGRVAKIVMAAAAKNLTPVTLELGGKSPVFIDGSADIEITAQRIAWGKWLNAGQTCVAPDYIMIEEKNSQALIAALKKQISIMFSDKPIQSESYGRIINKKHCQRLINYLPNEDVSVGGDFDIEKKYIAPTIVLNPSTESLLMTEEIFGPILPIVVVKSFKHAIEYIVKNDKPLAAYLFTRNKQQEQTWVNSISAGSIAINDVMMFNAVTDLPFGGVGASGMGQYSGITGFDNFSHLKSIIKRRFIKEPLLRFAPFSMKKIRILKWLR